MRSCIEKGYVLRLTPSNTLSKLPSTSIVKYKPITRNAQCHANELFEMSTAENNENFPINILNMQREQKKKLRNRNSKLGTYILDRGAGYSKEALDEVEKICYTSKIYMP